MSNFEYQTNVTKAAAVSENWGFRDKYTPQRCEMYLGWLPQATFPLPLVMLSYITIITVVIRSATVGVHVGMLAFLPGYKHVDVVLVAKKYRFA